MHAIKIAEASVVASKETGIVVNADKTKCMIMSRDKDLRLRHNIKTDINCFERVEKIEIIGDNLKESKFYSGRNKEQTEVREYLLPFGAESYVFQFVLRKYTD